MKEQKPLVIVGSARKQSDTIFYVDYVFGSTDHTLVNLLEYNISPYNYEDSYPSSDNFNQIVEEILNHDTIVFATPVYWYAMSCSMKTLFDRINDIVTVQKATGRKLKGKHVFLLSVGADPELPEGFEIPFKRTSDYLDMHYKGCIYFSTDKAVPNENNADKRRHFLSLF